MSNGFEMCDQHTYLFATEGKDCPYCEIDRLKAELEEWQETAKLAERRTYTYGEECKQLRIDLEESNENHTFYKSHSQDLERQLAEARAEVRQVEQSAINFHDAWQQALNDLESVRAENAELRNINQSLSVANKVLSRRPV